MVAPFDIEDKMKLGILVNSNQHLDDIIGIVKAASLKGHTVTIFVTDVGTQLLARSEFTLLSELERVSITFCEHSAEHNHIQLEGVPESISKGSQYNNAVMNKESDRVIVL